MRNIIVVIEQENTLKDLRGATLSSSGELTPECSDMLYFCGLLCSLDKDDT